MLLPNIIADPVVDDASEKGFPTSCQRGNDAGIIDVAAFMMHKTRTQGDVGIILAFVLSSCQRLSLVGDYGLQLEVILCSHRY